MWRKPLDKYKLGTAFGVKDAAHPNGHRGSDYNGVPEGTPLHAVTDGEIVVNKWSDVLGNVVVLKCNGTWFFGYCHMQAASPLKVGTKVKAGDVIGKLGNTGSATSGAHLHLTLGPTAESVFSGKVIDPEKALNDKIAGK